MGKIIKVLIAACFLSLGRAHDLERETITHSILAPSDSIAIKFNIDKNNIDNKFIMNTNKKFLNTVKNQYDDILMGQKENIDSALDFEKIMNNSSLVGKFLHIRFHKKKNINVSELIYLSYSLGELKNEVINFISPCFKSYNLFIKPSQGKIEIIAPPYSTGWLRKIVITPLASSTLPFALMLNGTIDFNGPSTTGEFCVVGAERIDFFIKKPIKSENSMETIKENLGNFKGKEINNQRERPVLKAKCLNIQY
jgi:hypothetical protein